METVKCDVCNEYEGSERQVISHQIHCKKKNAEGTGSETPEPRTRETADRKERIPFGAPQQKLTAPDDDRYQYRYFNDGWAREPGRIQRALDAGYEVVEGKEPVAVGTNDDGSPIKGILMKIPKEIYEEDQALKQKEVDRVDQAIMGGTLEQQAGDKRYIPDGIKIWSDTEKR
jgi:hypothetical protein